jgi:DNA polymerase-3 subunit epsilon
MKSQFDMFEAAAAALPASSRPRPPVRRISSGPISDEDMARHLEETGQYRILRRLTPRPVVAEPRPGFPRIGIVIDTETTGLKRSAAEVIEVGAVAFTSTTTAGSATSSASTADFSSRRNEFRRR